MPFNSHPFNTKVFNAGFANNPVHATDSVAFENTSLNDGVNVVLTRAPLSGPSREILGGAMPRGDGRFQTGDYFREYAIVLEGYLKAASASAMATAMDDFRLLLSAPQGNLDIIEPNEVVKRFVATCVNYDELFAGKEAFHVTLVPFTARFVCPTPYGRSRDYMSTSLAVSSSPTVQSVVHGGSAAARLVTTLIFDSASSVTALSVTNGTTGESVTYTGAVAANDVVVFDGENLRVLKNGSAVAYTGSFPVLKPGANLMSVSVTASAFSAYTTFSFRNTWL